MLVEPVLIDGAAQMHGCLHVCPPHEQERVLHAEIRVVTDARDHEDVAGAVVAR